MNHTAYNLSHFHYIVLSTSEAPGARKFPSSSTPPSFYLPPTLLSEPRLQQIIMTTLTGFLAGAMLGASLAGSVGVVAAARVPFHNAAALDKPVSFNQTCHVGSFAFDDVNSTLGLYCNTDDWQHL